MVKIGDWSYSIYLGHWPFIVMARILWPHEPTALQGAAVLSLIPAMLSYQYVEEPIRNLEGFSLRRWTGLVAAAIALPVI